MSVFIAAVVGFWGGIAVSVAVAFVVRKQRAKIEAKIESLTK